MYIDQNSRLRTVTESKANRTIPWGSVKLHAKNVLYASSYAKHGSSNASEIDCIGTGSTRSSTARSVRDTRTLARACTYGTRAVRIPDVYIYRGYVIWRQITGSFS